MRKMVWLVSLFLIMVSGNSFAEAATTAVEQLQMQRQAFAQDDKIDLQQLSREIGAVVRDSNALDQAGKDAEAMTRLQTLGKYAPLAQFPSFNVQMLCARLYTELSDASNAAGCRDRAAAMAEILQKQSGSGASPNDPVRVITVNEIAEWAQSQGAKISDVRLYPYRGSNLQAITYAGPATAGQSAVAYFQFTPRLTASMNASIQASNVFAPLPVSPSDGKYQVAMTQAHEARVRFLNDTSFNYLELIQLCRDSERDAAKLMQQGDFQSALSKLREVERIRPIKEIPIFDFFSVYSFLLGKTGDIDGQSNARLYLFGITQDIAHSGDGLTPQTAVHVIATSEEYTWIHEKKARPTMQRLMEEGGHRYDAIDTVDENGGVRTYYFEVSQVYAREGQSLRQTQSLR